MIPPDPSHSSVNSARILELDGLRGIAVLMVVLWHYVGAIIDPALGIWAGALARTLICGRVGVDLFFVLSGFLITGIILDRTRPPSHFLSSFYIRRAVRILPPYLLLVSAFWLIVAAGVSNAVFSSETPLWRHLTFTQNLWMAEQGRWGPGAISVTWSVAIEEQFYLLFPPLMLLLARRHVPAVLLMLAAVSIAYRAFVYEGAATAFDAYVSTPARLDALALGGVLAWAWRERQIRAWLESNRMLPCAVAGVGLALVPALVVFMNRDLGWHMFYWGHTYLSIFFCAALASVLLTRNDWLGRILRQRWLRFSGAISYSVYLFHPFILSCAFLLAARTERMRDLTDLAIVLVAFTATVLFCWLSANQIERPAIRIGRRFSY